MSSSDEEDIKPIIKKGPSSKSASSSSSSSSSSDSANSDDDTKEKSISEQSTNINNSQNATKLISSNQLKFNKFRHKSQLHRHFDKREYLQLNRKKCLSNDNNNKGASILEEINSDDEIFILQCAKHVDVEQLIGSKIKLNQNSTFSGKDYEYECEQHSISDDNPQQFVTVFCPNGKGNDDNDDDEASPTIARVKTLSCQNLLNVHEKLDDELIVPCAESIPEHVPYPTGLKVRHPFHGNDYQESIELPNKVRQLLDEARLAQIVQHSKCKSLNRRKHGIVKIKEEPMDDENSSSVQQSPTKSKRKRKHQNSISDPMDTDGGKKKTIKVENLDWLNDI